jgi:hypothetical protein
VDQRFCKPGVEPLEKGALDMFVRLSEPPTKQSEQVNAKVRPALEKGYEVPVIKNQQITIRHCRCIGGPLAAIEERHLTKDLPDS